MILPHKTFTFSLNFSFAPSRSCVKTALEEAPGEKPRKVENNFSLCYRINSMKIQFCFPVVENVKKSLFVLRSTHVCLFNFLLCQSFLFVRFSRSLLYLKPVNFQQTLFPSSSSINFSHHDKKKRRKKRSRCDDMVHGNGALLTNNINDVKWKMKLGV